MKLFVAGRSMGPILIGPNRCACRRYRWSLWVTALDYRVRSRDPLPATRDAGGNIWGFNRIWTPRGNRSPSDDCPPWSAV